MKAFKAYDVRGIYNRDFTADDVYKIGFFLPALLDCDKVLIGRDARVSSDEIFEALCHGITDAGADVHSVGLSTTPMIYFLTAHLGYDASVQITASHNPAEYNGLKISRTGALPVGYDTGLSDLERMMDDLPVNPVPDKGIILQKDEKRLYIDFLKNYVPDMSNLNLAVDCSNGMAALFVKDILGFSPFYLYDTVDGTFPNHEPNPLEEENVEDLKKAVIERKCDVGIIFDGDADRVMFVDEKGMFIPPDLIIALIGKSFLAEEKGNVLVDIRTSKSVSEYLTSLGGTVHMWKVGHAFAKVKLREIDAIFGGELAGHYYFRDFYSCDSGFLAALLVLKALAGLKKEGKTISSFISEIKRYENSGEINFRIARKTEAMEALRKKYTGDVHPAVFLDFDGYRIEFGTWWFNVRPSNTESYLRLVVEAETAEELDLHIRELSGIINSYAI